MVLEEASWVLEWMVDEGVPQVLEKVPGKVQMILKDILEVF